MGRIKLSNDNNKEIKKCIPEIAKFLKKADEISIEIERGIASAPDPKTLWEMSEPDGNTTITIHTYHKKRDRRDKLPKEPSLSSIIGKNT